MPPRNGFQQVKRDLPAPRENDRIPERMCLRCGMFADVPHANALECIEGLRDLVATLQLSRRIDARNSGRQEE